MFGTCGDKRPAHGGPIRLTPLECMTAIKVLIIEDDRALSELLEYNLEKNGFIVSQAFDGRDGLNQAQLKLPDVVILDVMLPVLDGVEVCRQLRARTETRNALILFLTARGEESDQLIGFSSGADDYVVKPFSPAVLLQRIRALLRRKEDTSANQEIISIGGVTVDRRRHKATAGDQELELTHSEFRLLEALIRQPGRAFKRSELIDSALGEDTLVLDRTIDVHIRALRKKLDGFADNIETVRGVGYRYKEA